MKNTRFLRIIIILIFSSSGILYCFQFPWSKNKIEYHDSTLINQNDTVTILCGTNPALGLRFWSQYLHEAIDGAKLRDPKRNYNLASFTGDGYMWDSTDISNWKTYANKRIGFSFRYPSNLVVDSSTSEYESGRFLALGVETRTPKRKKAFLPCIRISISNNTFSTEAFLHDWDTTRIGLWRTVCDDDWRGGGNGGIMETSFIEGNHWKALHGHTYSSAYEGLLFLAMVTLPNNQQSILFNFLEDPPRKSGVTIYENDICAILSSFR